MKKVAKKFGSNLKKVVSLYQTKQLKLNYYDKYSYTYSKP